MREPEFFELGFVFNFPLPGVLEMTAEVHAINGGDVALPGRPSEGVIECLEDLLARARAGEIAGISGAYTIATGEGWIQRASCFEAGHAYGCALVGALELVKYRLLRESCD